MERGGVNTQARVLRTFRDNCENSSRRLVVAKIKGGIEENWKGEY